MSANPGNPTNVEADLPVAGAPCAAAADRSIDLRLAVWPRSDGRGWRAELRMAGAKSPLRFERPMDLVLFLTSLPGGAAAAATGLR